MKNVFIILLMIILAASCSKSEELYMPGMEYTDTLDIDRDLRADFIIENLTYATVEFPPKSYSVFGSIRPLDNNQVLCHKSKGYLFLSKNDTIKREANADASWSDYSASVIGINSLSDRWDESWHILSDLNNDFYLGIKIIHENSEKIGWLRLEPDTLTGKIRVTDSRITSQPELIIKN